MVPVPHSTREPRLDQDSKSGESSNQPVISQIELNTIPVHTSVRNERIFKFNQRSYKRQLIPVLRQDIKYANDNRNDSWLPSFHLINARSLHAKVDELRTFLLCEPVDIIAITESWLHDDLIAVEGFKIYRNDRSHSRGGGVCAYISFNIPCQRKHDLECSNFECIWLWLRPKRSPRPLSGVAICLIYSPPASSVHDFRDLDEYIIDAMQRQVA